MIAPQLQDGPEFQPSLIIAYWTDRPACLLLRLYVLAYEYCASAYIRVVDIEMIGLWLVLYIIAYTGSIITKIFCIFGFPEFRCHLMHQGSYFKGWNLTFAKCAFAMYFVVLTTRLTKFLCGIS